MWWLWIILGVLAAVAIWVLGTYNSLIISRTSSEEAFSTMDIYLKKRYDLIPNVVQTVKGYAKHESDTFEKVIEARNMAMKASSGSVEQAKGENALTGTIKSLFAL
ncbi:MAG: LemA family protein, partial [Clostridia bacterium]|nr:LemA family protein [Clostridia bacterium]